jgi:hypothetical protein
MRLKTCSRVSKRRRRKHRRVYNPIHPPGPFPGGADFDRGECAGVRLVQLSEGNLTIFLTSHIGSRASLDFYCIRDV